MCVPCRAAPQEHKKNMEELCHAPCSRCLPLSSHGPTQGGRRAAKDWPPSTHKSACVVEAPKLETPRSPMSRNPRPETMHDDRCEPQSADHRPASSRRPPPASGASWGAGLVGSGRVRARARAATPCPAMPEPKHVRINITAQAHSCNEVCDDGVHEDAEHGREIQATRKLLKKMLATSFRKLPSAIPATVAERLSRRCRQLTLGARGSAKIPPNLFVVGQHVANFDQEFTHKSTSVGQSGLQFGKI